MYVVTADQKRSRTATDRVPALLADLHQRSGGRSGTARPFERTAGDEVQGLLDAPGTVVDAVVTLLRGGWWVGVGIGAIDHPLPETARAGRGPAYLAARQAVESAKAVPAGICVVSAAAAASAAGTRDLASVGEAGHRAEAAAWLLATLLGRRSPQGWQVVDLVAGGAKGVEAAAKLGISPQAVSSRLRVAGWAEEERGRELLTWLLGQADLAAAVSDGPQAREDAR